MNPHATLLLATLPLAAAYVHAQTHAQMQSQTQSPMRSQAHAQSQAQPPSLVGEGLFAQALPGIDAMRIAIPDGSLAGHSVVVFEVDSRRAPRDALDEIERHWRAQGVDTVLQAQTGEWFVLSRRAGPAREGNVDPDAGFAAFETLQLRASRHGGSEGLLTRWTQPKTPARGDALARLVPPDAKLVRQLSSGGGSERRAATLVARFARSLDDAERHLDRHLLRAGFEPMRADPGRDLRWRDDRARFYRSVTAELLVTLHRQAQETSAVLHHVEMPR